jgi:hypothetical protein
VDARDKPAMTNWLDESESKLHVCLITRNCAAFAASFISTPSRAAHCLAMQRSAVTCGQPKLPRDIKRGARDNLIDSRARSTPGLPVSEDQDEPRFVTIETALARHHKLLSRGAD